METDVTETRYNVNAVIGWVGLFVGLIGCAVQFFRPSVLGFVFLAVGVVGGGITITLSGPLKTTVTRRVDLPIKAQD